MGLAQSVLMRIALALLLLSCAALADHAEDGAHALQQRDFKRAASEYRAATRDAPAEASNWTQLALALQQQDDFAGSIEAYDRAFSLGAKSPALLYNAACALARAGQKNRALSLLEQIAEDPMLLPQQLLADTDLASLQGEPRFARVLARTAEAREPKVTQVSVSAAEVVAKALAARGGKGRIKSIQAERMSGRIAFGGTGPGAPFAVELKRPGKLRDEITLQGKKFVRVTDGKSGFSLEGEKPPRPLSAAELRNLAGSADFEGPLVDAQAKGNRLELLGKVKVSGRDAYLLRITQKDGQVRKDYVDCASFLEVKWQGSLLLQGKEVEMETVFSDFREVAGLQVPFHLESDTPGTSSTQRLDFDKVELDPAIDDSRFVLQGGQR